MAKNDETPDQATTAKGDDIEALKAQLADAEKRATEAEGKASAAPSADDLAAANKRADDAEKALADKAAGEDDLKAQLASLADRLAMVETKPWAEGKPNANGEVGRVVPGETDDFGRPWNPPKPSKSPKIYQATEKVYVDGVLYDAGDTVVTASPPSHTLREIDVAEKVAIEAAAPLHGDVNIADMSATELRSFLASKGVDHGGLKDRDALLQAAEAYDDPTR